VGRQQIGDWRPSKRAGEGIVSIDIKQSLVEWQEALRLQDWDVEAFMLSQPDFDFKSKRLDNNDHCGCQGINAITMRLLSSLIYVSEDAENKERTLVHELVHLILQPFWESAIQAAHKLPDPASSLMQSDITHQMEIATEKIARSLVNLRDIAQTTRPKTEKEKKSKLIK
jgi:hypothetical protein